jgi:hypothetical protein
MQTALHADGGARQQSTPTVLPTDRDLVAYWTFDEGSGYVVHDISNHGHDLYITNDPKWQVGIVHAW